MTKIIKMQQTRVTTTQRVMPKELNRNNTLFGGEILALIDRTCSISVNLVTKEAVATVSLDEVNFIAPIHQDDIYTLTCYASGIKESSVEVFFKIKGRNSSETTSNIKVVGFITFASLSHQNIPVQLIATNKEETYILNQFSNRLVKRYDKINQLKELFKSIN